MSYCVTNHTKWVSEWMNNSAIAQTRKDADWWYIFSLKYLDQNMCPGRLTGKPAKYIWIYQKKIWQQSIQKIHSLNTDVWRIEILARHRCLKWEIRSNE